MPDGPYPTPEEEAFLRLVRGSGSPEAAGLSILARLEALEAAALELERLYSEQTAAAEPGAALAEDA